MAAGTSETTAKARSGEPLVVLAAGGALPIEVATAAVTAGRDVFVIGLEGEIDARIATLPHAVAKWGQVGRVVDLIRAHGARDIVFAGTVTHRPDFGNLAVDFGTLRHLPGLIRAMFGGDDTVLSNIAKFVEDLGFRIVGPHEVAPGLVAQAGVIAGGMPTGEILVDLARALEAASAIGALDIGQGAVAVGGRVVAVEAAEGTDGMLDRVADLRANGRVRWSGRAGLLAKRAKPQQDLRLDMPVIGPRTVEAVARVGLAGIAVEAGRVLIAERGEAIALAGRTGTFIYGEAGSAQPGNR